MLNNEQKVAKKEFMSITNTSDTTASKYLKLNNWNLAHAIDNYYHNNPKKASSNNSNDVVSLENLFNKYKEPNEDVILVDGVLKYCEDLEVDPTDIIMLIIPYCLGCEISCEFKKENFIKGWSNLGCSTLDQMKAAIPNLRNKLETEEFKQIYQYAFTFGKNANQRSMSYEAASAYWKLLLENKYIHLDLWLEFINDVHKKAISKDVWSLFLDFINSIDSDFKNHDEDGAWPLLYDEFVEYARKKINS